jgi:hypothetical protein
MSGLLVRPTPVRGESRQGYLLRLSDQNVLGSPRRIKTEWLEALAPPATLRGPIAGLGALNAVDRIGPSARYWNTRRPRYCRHCLEEAPYWRSVWGLVFCVACHRHEVALVDDCRDCGHPLRWVRCRLLQCACGADLRDRTPQAASAPAIAASCALAAAWCDGGAPSEPATGNGGVEGLLYRTWLLGSYRSQAAERPQKLAGLYAMPQAVRIVEAAADVVSNGKAGYFDFLDQVAARYGDPASTRLAGRFGAFYKELFATKAAVALADLREGFEAYVRERWPGQIAERNSRLSADVRTGHVWIPVTRAAKQLCWRSSRLRDAIVRGVVRGQLHERPSGRIAGVVHREDLERLMAESSTWIDLTGACRILRIGKKAAHALIRSGQLPAVSGPSVDGRLVWQFRRTDVERLRPHASGRRHLQSPARARSLGVA